MITTEELDVADTLSEPTLSPGPCMLIYVGEKPCSFLARGPGSLNNAPVLISLQPADSIELLSFHGRQSEKGPEEPEDGMPAFYNPEDNSAWFIRYGTKKFKVAEAALKQFEWETGEVDTLIVTIRNKRTGETQELEIIPTQRLTIKTIWGRFEQPKLPQSLGGMDRIVAGLARKPVELAFEPEGRFRLNGVVVVSDEARKEFYDKVHTGTDGITEDGSWWEKLTKIQVKNDLH